MPYFLYWQILLVLRRQARTAVAAPVIHVANHPDVAEGQKQQQQQQQKPMTSTQKNLIKTMFFVTCGFVVCYTPIQAFLQTLKLSNIGVGKTNSPNSAFFPTSILGCQPIYTLPELARYLGGIRMNYDVRFDNGINIQVSQCNRCR